MPTWLNLTGWEDDYYERSFYLTALAVEGEKDEKAGKAGGQKVLSSGGAKLFVRKTGLRNEQHLRVIKNRWFENSLREADCKIGRYDVIVVLKLWRHTFGFILFTLRGKTLFKFRRASKQQICKTAKPWFCCFANRSSETRSWFRCFANFGLRRICEAAKPICCCRLVFVAEGRAWW